MGESPCALVQLGKAAAVPSFRKKKSSAAVRNWSVRGMGQGRISKNAPLTQNARGPDLLD